MTSFPAGLIGRPYVSIRATAGRAERERCVALIGEGGAVDVGFVRRGLPQASLVALMMTELDDPQASIIWSLSLKA